MGDEAVDCDAVPLIGSESQTKWYRRLIEFQLFLYFFASSLSGTVYNNLVLYKICTLRYGYNETICETVVMAENEGNAKEIEIALQADASTITMLKQLLEGIFPAIVCLFLGSWSDVNGRKPLIITSMFGYFTYYCLCVVYTLIGSVDPYYLLLATVPFSLLGGMTALLTASFCYISDITPDGSKSFRMSVLEGAIFCGMFTGLLLSARVYEVLGYVGVFAICAVSTLIGLIHSLTFLNESIIYRIPQSFTTFIDRRLISDLFNTFLKTRTQNRRLIMCLIMTASTMCIFIFQGDSTVLYYFTRMNVGWNLEEFTIFEACSVVSATIGIIITIVFLQKLIKLRDGIITSLAYSSAAAQNFIYAFTTKSWHMYFASMITCLRAGSGPTNRAILTSVVSAEESGKIIALNTFFETVASLISPLLYKYIYQQTLTYFSGAYNLLSGGLYIMNTILVVIVEILLVRQTPERIETAQFNE